VFVNAYFLERPGRYLFNLAGRQALDTHRYANGRIGITVDVADVCGNSSSISQAVQIAN
jgi:hypothetical protein